MSAGLVAQAAPGAPANTNVDLVLGIMLFVLGAFGAGFGGLLLGRFFRPKLPHPEKAATYECGEPTIGPSWVQFDLRFYTVALVFIVFDVEIALLWPWAAAFGGENMDGPAFLAFVVFFLLIAIPFGYEMASGYLSWVRASSGQRRSSVLEASEPRAKARAKVGTG